MMPIRHLSLVSIGLCSMDQCCISNRHAGHPSRAVQLGSVELLLSKASATWIKASKLLIEC